MYIEIVTPDAELYAGEINVVQLPGTEGSFELMNMHAPIVATLKKGKIKVVDGSNNTKFFDVNGGVVEMNKNKVIVLAE
jgi:F-type H+-transporting ATPase subunit epsilon